LPGPISVSKTSSRHELGGGEIEYTGEPTHVVAKRISCGPCDTKTTQRFFPGLGSFSKRSSSSKYSPRESSRSYATEKSLPTISAVSSARLKGECQTRSGSMPLVLSWRFILCWTAFPSSLRGLVISSES